MDNFKNKQIDEERVLFEKTMEGLDNLGFKKNQDGIYINTLMEKCWEGWLARAIVGFDESITNDMIEAGEADIYNNGHCDCGNPANVDSESIYKSMRKVAQKANKIKNN